MITFLDVGAYHGQRMLEALAHVQFNEIHCFEPSPKAYRVLDKVIQDLALKDQMRILAHPFGLWDKDGTFSLYGEGSPGASLFKRKRQEGSKAPEECQFIRALDYVRKMIRPETDLVIKLNCEGAECDIIDDLLTDPQVYSRILCMGIDFDAYKIPSMREHVQKTFKKLRLYNIPYAEMSGVATENRIDLLVNLFLKDLL